MIRSYPNQPDEAWMRRQYPKAVRGIGQVAGTLAEGRGDEYIADAGIDAALEAAAYGWFLGDEPVSVLRAHFTAALPFVRFGMDHPATVPSSTSAVIRRIVMAELAGDFALAAQVAAIVPVPVQEQPGDELCPLLAQLALGQDASAWEWAGALATTLQNPATPPFALPVFSWLSEIAGPVIGKNQAGFEEALRARGAAQTAHYRRSADNRRDWLGLLDHYSAGIALFGVRRGLTLPVDVPSLPVPLVLGS